MDEEMNNASLESNEEVKLSEVESEKTRQDNLNKELERQLEEEKKAKKEKRKAKRNNPVVNMAKKRTFLIIQILFLIAAAVALYFVPILTSYRVVDFFKSEQESLFSGKTFFEIVFGAIKNYFENKTFLLNINAETLKNSDGVLLFSNIPFVGGYMNESIVSIIVLVIYAVSYVCIFFSVLFSIFGLFTHKPIYNRWMGLTVALFVIITILTYLNMLDGSYKGYDTIFIYVFALLFLIWFFITILYAKVIRKYEKWKKMSKVSSY